MNQTTLHNYFRGTASEREEKLILDWVDASEENRKMFQKERMLYDLTLFQNTTETKKRDTRSNNLRHITRWGIRVAASVVVLLSCWTLISEYRYNHNSGMQTVTVPPGQRAEITLPDGTKVWLNAKSTLMYATDFGRKERNVELDGEAYFEVTKNAGKTFYVHTETKKIGVVGTSFNVNAYKGTNEFEAVLIEGIIDIYPAESDKIITRLEKNESFLAYQDKQKKIKSGSHEQLRWKDGL
ncbi:FecR family protein, partial [Bacteroides sp. OttesenSCG-928-J23]|nr:FecR family protein [Bacteroides sp. OttesenSCG-928-J23]